MKTRTMHLIASAVAFALMMNTFTLLAGGEPGKETGPKTSATMYVDPAKSQLIWTARKVGGEHTGTVNIAKGMLHIEGNKLVRGEFVMDMTSMTDTDITNEMMNDKLTNHLKSEDFFSVEKYPTSIFTITKVVPIVGAKAGETNYTITGDLSIKGIIKSITFPATVNIKDNTLGATATFEIDRTQWDIKYRAAIIGTAADKIIEDNFTIALKVVSSEI